MAVWQTIIMTYVLGVNFNDKSKGEKKKKKT
jgi:hypothetical protein